MDPSGGVRQMSRSSNSQFLRAAAEILLAAALALAWSPLASRAQDKKPLTNADVLQMAKSGFDDGTIEKAIQVNGGNFDVSVPALVQLKNGGVSQAVIDTMLNSAHSGSTAAANPSAAGNSAAAPQPSAPSDANNPLAPHDAGVYLYQGSGA